MILPLAAAAQTDKPVTVDRPTGVQITNMPLDDVRQRLPNPRLPDGSPEDQGAQDQSRQDNGSDQNRTQDNRRTPRETVPRTNEPDIEYQEFVTSSLGYQLPIFGQNLFRTASPSTFAPLDRVPVTPDYMVGPGDELLVRAWGQIDVNYKATVDRNGAIYIPKVGSLNVAGLRYDQLQEYLKSSIGRVFKNFDLSVTLGQLRSIQVFVVGQVRRPGVYTVSSLSTLVNALFASGGPSKRGSLRRIQLKRAGMVVTTFDMYDLLCNGDKSQDKPLLPGDVIYVPPVGRLVALAGSVNVPAIYELKDHETLGSLLDCAGGLTTTAAGERAIVERIDGHHVRRADEFVLTSTGLERPLQDGDIVRFLHVSPKFENAITLRGNVALPGRYPFRDGMRVHDLIPNREFLVTEDFWKRQNQLGRNVDGRTFLLPEEMDRLHDSGVQQTRARLAPDGMLRPTDPERGDANDADAGGDDTARRLSVEELKNQIKRSAAEINWEYAVIQRLNPDDLTTRLVPFNLGQAIEGVEAQNLILQPGDVVTVFSQKDIQVPVGQQTKFIKLEGEFHSSGVYQVQPGETLRHMVKRVGGLTPQAYLYGAEFTRESTREDQQERLDTYIRDLEQQVERSAGGRGLANPEETAAQHDRVEGQRRLLQKMRELRATGRVVLELNPTADALSTLPDLVLEDGDRLMVPFRPATVNVIGSVYNGGSFLFRPGKTVSEYLGLSGGATRTGDKSKTFVIRANGETISNQNHNGLLTANFNKLRLMPGDTVVVPEKLDPGAAIRGLKDWSTIIGQFALGAAAATVFVK